MNILTAFENRSGAKSVNLHMKPRIHSRSPHEITKSELNRVDNSSHKLEVKPLSRPPSGLKQRRFSCKKTNKRISICDKSKVFESSQENIKENMIFVRKYQIPEKRPTVRRRNTQVIIKKVFNMTQTDLSDEEAKSNK